MDLAPGHGGQFIDRTPHDILDAFKSGSIAVFPDLIDPLGRNVEENIRLIGLVVAQAGDLVHRSEQTAQQRFLAHQVSIMHGIGHDWNRVRQRADVGNASSFFQQGLAFEVVTDGQEIDRFAGKVQLADGIINQPVVWPVEVIGLEQGGDFGKLTLAGHGTAQDRLLGLDIVRQDPDGRPGFDWSGCLSSHQWRATTSRPILTVTSWCSLISAS